MGDGGLSVKVFFFECGTLKSEKHLFTLNIGVGEPFEVPVPFFLIQHNDKNILFDTGNALAVSKNPEKHWGQIIKTYYPVMDEKQYVVNQLEDMGIGPENIDYVVLSHLHLDHAGGVGAFPNAVYIAHKKEVEWAFDPECSQKSAYIMPDIDKNIKWRQLENQFEESYDLFKDELGGGPIQIYPTPGHTPGHLSILIKLEKESIFLTSDCCYTEENLYDNIPPGLVWNAEDSIRTINWIKKLKDEKNIKVVTGHDPIAWKRFKKAPEYYS